MYKVELKQMDIEDIVGAYNVKHERGTIQGFNSWLFQHNLVNQVAVSKYLDYMNIEKGSAVHTRAQLVSAYTHKAPEGMQGSLLQFALWLHKMGFLHEFNCYVFKKAGYK